MEKRGDIRRNKGGKKGWIRGKKGKRVEKGVEKGKQGEEEKGVKKGGRRRE